MKHFIIEVLDTAEQITPEKAFDILTFAFRGEILNVSDFSVSDFSFIKLAEVWRDNFNSTTPSQPLGLNEWSAIVAFVSWLDKRTAQQSVQADGAKRCPECFQGVVGYLGRCEICGHNPPRR